MIGSEIIEGVCPTGEGEERGSDLCPEAHQEGPRG